jgi:hypothetical protein
MLSRMATPMRTRTLASWLQTLQTCECCCCVVVALGYGVVTSTEGWGQTQDAAMLAAMINRTILIICSNISSVMVRSRRQKRSKLKELNASCIWRITPTPSPSPERSASPVVNGNAVRCAAPCHLRLTCDTRLLTCLSGLLGSHCHHARLQLFRLRRTCHAVLLQEGEEAGGQGSRQQRQ